MRLLTHILAAVAIMFCIVGCGKKNEKPTKFALGITTVPAGAKIFDKDSELGATPEEPPGTYRFRIEKEGFETEWVLIKVTDAEIKHHIVLRPITTDVLIISKPSEAQVEIDDVVVGETPLTLKKQRFGVHQATVKKMGFVTQRVDWDVQSNRPLRVTANLTGNIGRLLLDSAPASAAVSINGQACGMTPVNKELEQGKYRVVVTKEGYSTFEDQVIVERNKTVNRSVQLYRLPGSLKLTSAPAGAAISINGKAEGSTPFTVNNLKAGKYEVKAEKAGFDPAVQEIEVVAGREIPLHFDLGSNTGGIDLAVNPPGATIYLDGKLAGKVLPDEDGKFAKVFQLRGLSAGIHTVAVAHKRAVPQQKTLKITVEKGKVFRPKKINMWIANAELKLKSGRTMVGYLASETPLEVFFEPEPGVRQGFRRGEIDSLEMLKGEE